MSSLWLMEQCHPGKGSRQNGSVTSGKGLALSVGSLGLRLEAGGASLGWPRLTLSGPLPSGGGEDRQGRGRTRRVLPVDWPSYGHEVKSGGDEQRT